MNKKTAILFVTMFGLDMGQEKQNFEAEMTTLFDPTRFDVSFFHAESTDEQLMAQLQQHVIDEIPRYVVLHNTCTMKKIAHVTNLVAPLVPRSEICYRKYGEEQLQASMLKFFCFYKLLKRLHVSYETAAA